jgi:L-threonylcarbamoyladenylate synthase
VHFRDVHGHISNVSDSVQAEILPTDTAVLFDAAVSRAAELLRAGEPVALPTETVYGLAANAMDAQAVAKVFKIKGRPAGNPVIVHVASFEMARRCTGAWPAVTDRLARAFWPGPLTLVLPRSKEIPDVVTAGGPTVGVRWPGHPFMQAVIRQCGFPLAAPSANSSAQVSPTNARHVLNSLGGKVRLIVDGGQSQIGIESTVLDVTANPPRVLRPGMIHDESLLAITGKLQQAGAGGRVEATMRSPGLLLKHYAPGAKLVILSWRDDTELVAQLAGMDVPLRNIHVIAHTRIPLRQDVGRVCVIPHDPEAFARAIYSELHRCDEGGAGLIVVESLPVGSKWAAIADRLSRAAA